MVWIVINGTYLLLLNILAMVRGKPLPILSLPFPGFTNLEVKHHVKTGVGTPEVFRMILHYLLTDQASSRILELMELSNYGTYSKGVPY